MNKKSQLLTIVTLPILIASFMQFSSNNAFAGNKDCNASRDLNKGIDKNTAWVINEQSTCNYEITFALYDSPKKPETTGWIAAQTLIGSVTKKVAPGEKVYFTVKDTGNACARQADLFEGNEVLNPPYYYNNLATSVYTISNCDSKPTSTPTPTLTNTPTPSLTPTSTPGPTSTPAPGPTSTPKPDSSSTSTSNNSTSYTEGFAGTGNTGFIYAIILTGAIFLISGMVLRKIAK